MLMLKQFEEYMKNNPIDAKSFHPHYEKALNEMISAGGKRFRPHLLFTVINTYNPELLNTSFDIGYAIEIMHTYSLIHDDLPTMDDADLRRGYPTLHKTYNDVTAVLVGDALNTHAFFLIANSNLGDNVKTKLTLELASNAGANGMALGQAIDCHYDFNNQKLNLDEITFMHLNKTAKCIAGPLKMGAIICNLEEDMQENIYQFGLNLGLLFQIQDDIFDVTKDESEAQKSVNVDDNKNTFVTLLGLDAAIKKADELVEKLEKGLNMFDNELKNNLKDLLDKYIYRHQKDKIKIKE